MARRPALLERRLNAGLQTLPSGLNAFPVPRNSDHHRSINQSLPELWSDFSDRGQREARNGADDRTAAYHGELSPVNTIQAVTQRPSELATAAQSRNVLFAGWAEFDMDGRKHTAGEMDRLMAHAASSKYPCSRPATLDEYVESGIKGLPARNTSGRDVVFVGPGATGCSLFHTNTLGSQKAAVSPGDPFDGNWGVATLYGRKCVLCVYPVERLRKQQSLAQFGITRGAIGRSGRLKRAGSLASLRDETKWTVTDFAGSTTHAATTMRSDQFFR